MHHNNADKNLHFFGYYFVGWFGLSPFNVTHAKHNFPTHSQSEFDVFLLELGKCIHAHVMYHVYNYQIDVEE